MQMDILIFEHACGIVTIQNWLLLKTKPAAKAAVYSVAKTAHDRKVVGSNPVTSILDGSGVRATQD